MRFLIDRSADLYFDDLDLQIININNSPKASLENSSAQWAIFLSRHVHALTTP